MKKMLSKILFLLLVIFLLPVFALAERVESDMAPTNANIKEFKLDKITVKEVSNGMYINYHNTGKRASSFVAKVVNDYSKDVEVLMELHVYDKNKKLLDIFPTNVKVKANSEADYMELVYESNINYLLDDIKYYSLVSDINSDLVMYGESEKDLFLYQNYHIKIKVNENNVYNVEESFDVMFNKHVNTIKFGIPFRLKYTEDDGSKINKRIVMSNIKVDDEYTLKTEDGFRNLYIGEADKEAKLKSYVVKYDYDAGLDTIKKQDEFFFYLINYKDNKVDGLEFEIEFPHSLENERIYFVDQHGTVIDNFEYDIDDNKIIGNYKGMINSEIYYAIKVVLEDNYFKNASRNISDFTVLSLFISVLFLAITILIWFAQRRRDSKVEYGSIYFDKPINSLEMGYLYHGSVKDRDIATLLMALANKGFIVVDKTKKNYKIVKVKDYNLDDRVEKVFMNELFKEQDTITRKDLVNNVDCMKNNIEFKLKDHKKKNKLFISSFINYKILFWIMMIIIFVVNTVNIFFEYQTSAILINCILGSIGFIALLYGMLYEKVKIEKALYVFVGLILIVSPIVLTKYLAFIQDSLKLTTYITGIISMLIIVSVSKIMSNRTLYGAKMYNKIEAYKRYLLKFDDADKELKKNENCFYDVLPYTFVLGISDKWFNRFRNEKVKSIKWYKSNEFNFDEFYSDIKDIYADIFISLKNSEK